MKILMVCLGNICRSPLAEGILTDKIRTAQLNWQVDSAGTGDWHVGEPPDRRSVAVARQNGIDISNQRCRQIQQSDFTDFDLILTMDKANQRDVERLARTAEHRAKVRQILNFIQPDSDAEVPDPYYDNRFALVFELLDEACAAVLSQLRIKN